MQDLPSADRPTLYSMQASFLAAIYCMGLGTLTTAFRLFAESITMAIDGGLHRDVGAYDIFNPIEREVRKVSPDPNVADVELSLTFIIMYSSGRSGPSTAGTSSRGRASAGRP